MRFGLLLRALAVTAIVVTATMAAGTSGVPERTPIVAQQGEVRSRGLVSIPHPTVHPVPFVDGAQNPALIPDDIAFSLFFGSLRRTSAPYSDPRRQSAARSVFSADVSGRPASFGHEHAEVADAMNALIPSAGWTDQRQRTRPSMCSPRPQSRRRSDVLLSGSAFAAEVHGSLCRLAREQARRRSEVLPARSGARTRSDHLTGGGRSLCEACSLIRVASDPRSSAVGKRWH